jgi:hypothetical protein
MIQKYRTLFNEQFSTEKYNSLKAAIASEFDHSPPFRIAETPIFIDNDLQHQLLDGCRDVISFIQDNEFKNLTSKSLDVNFNVPNEDLHTTFLAIDFGICEENGNIVPKLIEVQGFPSLFSYQPELYNKFVQCYPFLKQLTPFLNGITEKEYFEILRDAILAGHDPKHVVLLEIEPEKQNTLIDFLYCKKHFGIEILCITDIRKKGTQLFYTGRDGEEIQVKRIYNRVIFDELQQRNDLQPDFKFNEPLEVEWAGHPNWFYRISKFILPYLKGKYFIETTLLSELESIPEDLENYVLKPLFSFSGTGVVYHVNREDIEAVKDRDLYILQKKVKYLPVVQSPDGNVKAEIRILCVWKKDDPSPAILCNLSRLSRGEMIGVKFNKDKDWVGGTIALFQND